MNPIKIFLFLSLLLLIAYGFDNKETFLEKEITIVKDSLLQITIVESTPIVKVEPDTIVEKNIRQNSTSS